MKIKTLEVGMSYTLFPKQYHACRAEAKIVFELEDDDDWDLVGQEARKELRMKLDPIIEEIKNVHETEENAVNNGGW